MAFGATLAVLSPWITPCCCPCTVRYASRAAHEGEATTTIATMARHSERVRILVTPLIAFVSSTSDQQVTASRQASHHLSVTRASVNGPARDLVIASRAERARGTQPRDAIAIDERVVPARRSSGASG